MELNNKDGYGFIPYRIENKNLRCLRYFPYNILLVRYFMQNNSTMLGYAEYVPNLDTYKNTQDKRMMSYRNTNSKDYWIEIVYRKNNKSYSCYKMYLDNCVATFQTATFKGLFIRLAKVGLSVDEPCKVIPVAS